MLVGGCTKALDEKIEGQFCVIDWQSAKIHRKVRSTLAAEAASASSCHDRATLVRHTLAWLKEHPEKGARPHWTVLQRNVRYVLLTDCRSLSEHCQKASSSLTENESDWTLRT